MDGFQIAFLVLAAVVVGALLPLLVQLYLALHHLRRGLEETTRDVKRVAERFDRLSAGLEKDGRLDAMASAVLTLSDLALELREILKIASAVSGAVAPALAAAVRAWRAEPARASDPIPGPDGPGGEESNHEPKKEVSP